MQFGLRNCCDRSRYAVQLSKRFSYAVRSPVFISSTKVVVNSVSYKYMSRSQPNQPPTFTSFADYCLHKDSLTEAARHTVEVLLEIADTSDCNEAERILLNCTSLNLDSNLLTDISPLSTLTNLTELYLHNNKITDISPLSTLTNLTSLSLNNNLLTDTSGLSTLTNLANLYLNSNKITDTSGLSTLTNLTYLSLDNNLLTDTSGLSTLTNLTHLYLNSNKITDISGLSTLTNLRNLNLDSNQITDLSPLQSLGNLDYVFVYGVELPKKYFLPQHEWLSQWVLEEENAEVRRLLIQVIGYERICQELEATQIDDWREYTLLKIDVNVDDEPIYLLKMTCPSTGHIHVLRVPPEINSAREAIRWVNWGIDPEEFAVQT